MNLNLLKVVLVLFLAFHRDKVVVKMNQDIINIKYVIKSSLTLNHNIFNGFIQHINNIQNLLLFQLLVRLKEI